jgi:hypothetical protein
MIWIANFETQCSAFNIRWGTYPYHSLGGRGRSLDSWDCWRVAFYLGARCIWMRSLRSLRSNYLYRDGGKVSQQVPVYGQDENGWKLYGKNYMIEMSSSPMSSHLISSHVRAHPIKIHAFSSTSSPSHHPPSLAFFPKRKTQKLKKTHRY